MNFGKKPAQSGAVLRTGRLRLLAYAVSLLMILLGIRLFYLQIIRGQMYSQLAKRQQTQKVDVESRRGRIVDRNGQELAVDLPQYYSVGVYPADLTQGRFLAQTLASFTGRPVTHYQNRLNTRSKFLYLEWRLTEDQAKTLEGSHLSGVVLNKTAGRFYPYDRASAQLLGYTDVDGHGISGLEVSCDSLLQGCKGWEMRQRNGSGGSFWDPFGGSIAPQDGGTVRLSIDIVAQEMLCQELEASACSTQAQWVAGLLMDPRTGEILAAGSVPDYDPMHPERGEQSNHKLRPLTELIEPGSIFKVITATAALDEGKVRPSDMFYCEAGHWRVGDHILRDAHPYGTLSFEDVIVHSSNIGTAKVAERIGSRELFRYAVRYGFGNLSCVEFPGEASGKLRPFDEWRDIGRANVAIGQGVSVTMLQMALAYSAIANDGIMMEPRLILDMTDMTGAHHSNPPREVRRVMEPETARTLQDILLEVVNRGTGKTAQMDCLEVAGKTGTAQIPNLETGGYYQNRYVASFVGFLPVHAADRVLVVTVYDPKGAHFGALIAGQVFKRVMQRLLPADAMRRSWEATPVQADGPVSGNDLVLSGKPHSGGLRTAGQTLSSISATASPGVAETSASLKIIPDLRGVNLRQAIRMLSARGIKVKISGTGNVLTQSLTPGSPVEKNSICYLTARCETPLDSLSTGRPDSGQQVNISD
jgi:cell division protein FtsI (penicillin-binding protein 3)